MGNLFNFLKCSRLFLSNKTGIIRCSTYTTGVALSLWQIHCFWIRGELNAYAMFKFTSNFFINMRIS